MLVFLAFALPPLPSTIQASRSLFLFPFLFEDRGAFTPTYFSRRKKRAKERNGRKRRAFLFSFFHFFFPSTTPSPPPPPPIPLPPPPPPLLGSYLFSLARFRAEKKSTTTLLLYYTISDSRAHTQRDKCEAAETTKVARSNAAPLTTTKNQELFSLKQKQCPPSPPLPLASQHSTLKKINWIL